jgi:hypothetical protein
MTDAPFDIRHASSYTPMWFSLKAETGPHAGTTTEFTVNADGSVWVSDWTALEWWKNQTQPNEQTFGTLVLLLAARGHIREVDAEERDRIAKAAPGQVEE